jgi:hypothetical protein
MHPGKCVDCRDRNVSILLSRDDSGMPRVARGHHHYAPAGNVRHADLTALDYILKIIPADVTNQASKILRMWFDGEDPALFVQSSRQCGDVVAIIGSSVHKRTVGTQQALQVPYFPAILDAQPKQARLSKVRGIQGPTQATSSNAYFLINLHWK